MRDIFTQVALRILRKGGLPLRAGLYLAVCKGACHPKATAISFTTFTCPLYLPNRMPFSYKIGSGS
jgi:hypothetical protein